MNYKQIYILSVHPVCAIMVVASNLMVFEVFGALHSVVHWTITFTHIFNNSSLIHYLISLSCTNPGRREKITEIFILTILCGASKGFMKVI